MTSTTQKPPTAVDYAAVATCLSLFTAALLILASRSSPGPQAATELVPPLLAMVGLTGLVWLLMVAVRNVAILRGIASANYYIAYTSEVPSEHIERPARTFNNLLQVPVLFYVVCLLMLATEWRDDGQLVLAWIFVATRCLHAAVYIGFNNVKVRFTCWMMGCITLAVLWFRFAMHGPT